jgi:hypothetical protein
MSTDFGTAENADGFWHNPAMRSTGGRIHPALAGALLVLLLSIHPRTIPLSPAPLSRAQAVLALERSAPEGYCAAGRTTGIERPAREPHPVFALGAAGAPTAPPSSESACVHGGGTRAWTGPRAGIPHDRAPPAKGSSFCRPRPSRA